MAGAFITWFEGDRLTFDTDLARNQLNWITGALRLWTPALDEPERIVPAATQVHRHGEHIGRSGQDIGQHGRHRRLVAGRRQPGGQVLEHLTDVAGSPCRTAAGRVG
mgnify:CR=1 FL=1